ncbi:MAG: hypothetical protein LBI82_09030, partial [Dysgonamonadaceae bacterium]|nr:hypothetical protein [Dysgonamonadaceae bacterium]
MKKTLFIVLAVMFAFSASAQKVKIKKGEIQLDGVSVVKIEKPKGSDAFVFRDLSGNQLFTVSEETKAPSGFPFLNSVLLFTGTNGNMQEISTKDIKYPFVFGKEYNMAYLVINSGADLITAQGVNMDKVNEFFKTSNRSVSEAFIAEIELAEAELAKEDELANSVELTVKRDGNIMANGKKIGRISVTRSESGSSCSYRISEYNDIFIASMDAKMTTDPEFYETKTYDGKVFSVYSGKGFSFLLDSNDTAKRLVRKLYYQGYKLGNLKEFFEEKKRAEEEALKAKKEASIEASGNIYNKQGYIIDKKGKKIEGLITLEFVPRFEAEGKRDATAEELRGYGNRVTI